MKKFNYHRNMKRKPMSESDTPRTDKELRQFENWCEGNEIYGSSELVTVEYARRLETELTAKTAELEHYKAMVEARDTRIVLSKSEFEQQTAELDRAKDLLTRHYRRSPFADHVKELDEETKQFLAESSKEGE